MTDEQRNALRALCGTAAGVSKDIGSFAAWGQERRQQVLFVTQLLILDALERIAGPVAASQVEPEPKKPEAKPKQVHLPPPKREKKPAEAKPVDAPKAEEPASE